jgi:Tol biopolymer transport system component
MSVIVQNQPLIPSLPWRAIAPAALLAALLASALLIAASQQRVPPPFGLAANGALLHDSDGDIYIRSSLQSEPRLLIGGQENDFAPNFTRDGRRITFLREAGRRPGAPDELLSIGTVNPDGTDVRILTGGLEAPDWGDVSADSRFMVLQASQDNLPGLYTLDLETGETRALRAHEPSWTPNFRGPDGKEIIFRGWTDGDTGPRMAIMSIRPDGTGLRTLSPLVTDLSGGYDFPQVSPDGRWVTYNGFDAEGTFRVHRLEIDTGRIEVLRLGPDGGHQGYATFSPDGSHFLFHWLSNDNQVRVMTQPTDLSGPAVPLGPFYPVINGSAELSQTFSPDGTVVIVHTGHGGEARMVDPATGGDGTILPWNVTGVPGWQRLPRN